MSEDSYSARNTLKRELAAKTISGLSWSFASSAIKVVLRIGTLAVLARLVTPAEFGVVTAAWIVLDLIERFYQIGIVQALVQRSEIAPRHVRTGFTLCLLSGVVFSAVCFALSPVASAFFQMPGLLLIMKVISLQLILSSLGAVASALLQREMAFDRLAIIDVVAKVFGYGAVGIGMGLAGYGVWALVGAAMGYRFLMTAQLLLTKRHSMKPLLDRGAVSDLMGFGSGITMAGLLNFVAQEGDNFIVGRWLGEVALGIYGRAYNMLRMPLALFGKVLNQVMFAALSQVQDDRSTMGAAYRRGSFAIAVIVLPLSMGIFVLAPELVDVVLGRAWGPTVPILQIFAVGMLFRTAYPFSGTVARSSGAVYRLALRQGLYGLLVLTAAWFGRPWGLEGVAIGITLAVFLQYLMMVRLSMSIVSLSWTELALAHLPGVTLATLVGVVTACTSALLRPLGAPSIIVLAVSGALTAVLLYALMRTVLSKMLGADGVWLMKLISKSLPARLSFGRRIPKHATS